MDDKYTHPEASHNNKTHIFKLAELVNDALEFQAGDDIINIVHHLGGEIEVTNTLLSDPEKSGSLYVDDQDDFKIILPSHTSTRRDRFTIAHELGHLFLHYTWQKRHEDEARKYMFALRKESERVEWEANWFAAAFLMPSEKFQEIYMAEEGDINSIAEIFDVSNQAAEIRAKNLGLT